MQQSNVHGPRRLALVLLLALPLGFVFAQDKPADEVGWGKEQDGLSCRLVLAQPEIVQGQGAPLTVEVRNRSKEPRTVLTMQSNYWAPHHRSTPSKDDPSKILLNNVYPAADLRPEAFTTIQPGQTLRFPIPKTALNMAAQGQPGSGKFTLTYHYTSVKPTAAPVNNLWTGSLVSEPLVLTVRGATRDELTVHEWGVFTVYPELKYANVDLKKEWESMPEFFYRQFPELKLKRVILQARKPILYFYSKTEGLEVNVEVDFPDGAPVIWWPCASAPIHPEGPNAKHELYRRLTWNAWVGDKVPASYSRAGFGGPQPGPKAPQFKSLPASSWLTKARLEEATPLTVHGSPQGGRLGTVPLESERFLYYDGLLQAPDFVRCIAVSEQGLTLKNQAAFALAELFVVDRRSAQAGKVRYSHVPQFAAGQQVQVAFKEVPENDWPAAGVRAVEPALLQAGLTAAETKSLLAIWHDTFFKAEGVTVFHLLPRAEYDRRLPLKIAPQPGDLVRVGIVHYPRLDLALGVVKRAEELIGKLDDASFQVREQATRDLIALGPPAFPSVRKALAARPSLEQATRLEKVLSEAGDASMWLNLPQPGQK